MKPNNPKTCFKILWWNVNRRPDIVQKNISPFESEKPNIIFLSETAMGYDILPDISNYQKYMDQSISQINHGGVVAYVHISLVSHVFDVQYETCYVSFRLDFAPSSFLLVHTFSQKAQNTFLQSYLDLSVAC